LRLAKVRVELKGTGRQGEEEEGKERQVRVEVRGEWEGKEEVVEMEMREEGLEQCTWRQMQIPELKLSL